MKENRERAIKHLFEAEGYISDDKRDRGGLTVFGITSKWFPDTVRQVRQYLDNGDRPGALRITADFYVKEFWTPLKCDTLPEPLDIYAFVQGVNQGVPTVKNMIVYSHNDPDAFLRMSGERYDNIVAENPDQARYLGGWMNRIKNLKKEFGGGEAA